MSTRRKFTSFKSSEYLTQVPSNSLITIPEYKQKLQNLLQKVSIQNKYTNRISHCNIKNIEQLQQVKKQLQILLDREKLQQKNQVLLKNLNNQLAQRLAEADQKLAIVANQVFMLKKQIKIQKKIIKQLKEDNQKLHQQLKKQKMEKYKEMIEVYDRQDNKLISTLIQDYIKDIVTHPSSTILYKHCIETLRNKSFNNFIKGLQVKMCAIEIQNKEFLRVPGTRENKKSLLLNNSNLLDCSGVTLKNKKEEFKCHRKAQSSFKLPYVRVRTEVE